MEYRESSQNIINFNDVVTGVVGAIYKMVRGKSSTTAVKYGGQQLANSALSHNAKRMYNPISPIDLQYVYHGGFQYLGDTLMHDSPNLYKSLEASAVAYAGDVTSNLEFVRHMNFAHM